MLIVLTEGPAVVTVGNIRFTQGEAVEVSAETGAALLKKESVRFAELPAPASKKTSKEG